MDKTGIACALLLAVLLIAPCGAEEYTFDLSEIEKKPYTFGGLAEFRPVLSGLDHGAAFHKLRFYNRDEGQTSEQFNFRLQLDGNYEKGISRLFVRFNSDLNHSSLGWDDEYALYEGFLSLKPSPSLTLDFGKRTLKWGKGYAWNPVAFIDRPKDPDDPELALEGFWVFSLDYIRSYEGPLKTFSFTPVILPVLENINDEFGKLSEVNLAGKFYFLLYDTDIDFIFFTGGSRTTRYGMDFSRNVTSNFEIHGEFALIKNYEKRGVDKNGNPYVERDDKGSYLLGARYLSVSDTTYIFEYYRNGPGYTEAQMNHFYSFVDRAYDQYLSTANDNLLKKASGFADAGYGRVNPMKDYFYLRVSQKEPFDILYFTPSVTGIWNLDDQSFSLSPELLYTGIDNLELRLKGTFLSGSDGSEYGAKPNDYRLELRVRYYF